MEVLLWGEITGGVVESTKSAHLSSSSLSSRRICGGIDPHPHPKFYQPGVLRKGGRASVIIIMETDHLIIMFGEIGGRGLLNILQDYASKERFRAIISFLSEARSSKYSYWWNFSLAVLSFLHLLFICLETGYSSTFVIRFCYYD